MSTDRLDINTPRGQVTVEQERRLAKLFELGYPGLSYVHTPKGKPSGVDAVIVNGRGEPKIEAVVESKCREMSMHDLTTKFKNEWLVTFAKLAVGQHVADILCVPYYGFLYLVPDDLLLFVCLYVPGRGWLTRFRVEQTETQATVNGGSAVRANAYIDMSSARLVNADSLNVA